jgi:hypothetical protein
VVIILLFYVSSNSLFMVFLAYWKVVFEFGLGLFGQFSLCIFMKNSSVSKSQVGHFILAFASLITSLSAFVLCGTSRKYGIEQN